MIFSYADPSSKIAAADDTPRSSPCLCRMQRLFVSCCPGVPDSQNIISYETAHERNYLEIRETPFPLTGWKRNGCRSPRQICSPSWHLFVCRSDLPSNATFTRPGNTSGIFCRRMNDGKGLGILLPLADNRIITQKEL